MCSVLVARQKCLGRKIIDFWIQRSQEINVPYSLTRKKMTTSILCSVTEIQFLVTNLFSPLST